MKQDEAKQGESTAACTGALDELCARADLLGVVTVPRSRRMPTAGAEQRERSETSAMSKLA